MIFLSYSWEDKEVTSTVEAALIRMGVAYWIDRNDLNLQYCLQPQILRAVQRSFQVLCITSNASRLSPWVNFEMKIASKFDKKIIRLGANNKYLTSRNRSQVEKVLSTSLICQ